MSRRRWSAILVRALLGAVALGGGSAAAEDPPAVAPPPWERVTVGLSPWLSPSGARLAFERYGVDLGRRDERGQPIGTWLLWIRDLATGEERRSPTDGAVTGWAGDDVVVFADGTAVRVAGSGPTSTFARAATEAHTPSFARSRDGRRVAYVVQGLQLDDMQPGTTRPGREHTVHVVADGGPSRALDLGEYVDRDHADGLLSFSPDGRRLAFHLGFMHYGQLPHPRVGVVDVETSACTFVADETAGAWSSWGMRTEGPTAAQAWDAKGARFVAVRAFGPKKRDLLTAAADGTDVRRLTVDGRVKASPCLSPDGERCAYLEPVPVEAAPHDASDGFLARRVRELTSIVVVALRTGERTVVATSALGDYLRHLQWSPDGAWLWFSAATRTGLAVARVAAPPAPVVPAGTPLVDRRVDPRDADLEALASDDRHEVEAAVGRLGDDDDPRVTAALVVALRRWTQTAEAGPLWRVLQAVEHRRALAAIPALLDALSRPGLVSMVTRVLLSWGVGDGVPAWRAAARAHVPAARGFATVALARFGDAAAWAQVGALVEAARVGAEGGGREHRDDMPDEVRAGNDTRAAVADALRYVRDPRSVELLLPLLDDVGFLHTSERDVLVRDSAARSLKALTGEEGMGTDRAAWTAWWEKAGKTLPPASGGAR